MCGHCEAAVKKALEALDGVAGAEVSHEKRNSCCNLGKGCRQCRSYKGSRR